MPKLLSSTTSVLILAVLCWFIWNIVRVYLEPYLPEIAVDMITSGLVGTGTIALALLLGNLLKAVKGVQHSADEAKDKAVEAVQVAVETRQVVDQTLELNERQSRQLGKIQDSNVTRVEPGGPVDTLIRAAIKEAGGKKR